MHVDDHSGQCQAGSGERWWEWIMMLPLSDDTLVQAGR